MSRRFFEDPFFALLEHPYHSQFYRPNNQANALDSRNQPGSKADNFYGSTFVRSPAVELTEGEKEYIVEAEIPGVRKEDLEVRVGEGGKSLTIEGKVFKRQGYPPDTTTAQGAEEKQGTEVSKPGARAYEESVYSSIFSRTFTLPRPVDGSRVKATLENGVLLLHIPQLEERGSVKVNIE
ncbi:HSP20-like chaperone [Calocera viscosa TUFC12733]|uniref:HSP20-like chaperone n=1 Tax=Calocera viscosa (strain TUFC12733) TaxID=1330018 RepID=A0A167JUU6_CALVF|nr:HSP20-like chaperone [Calocera viscosa TUFC12733]